MSIELKTEFIEEDSRDPHLHENLKSLGPVTIAPTVTKMRSVSHCICIWFSIPNRLNYCL
jgi:hypothetical protein